MRQKWIALLLASAMVLSLLGASAAAVDEKQSEKADGVETEETETEMAETAQAATAEAHRDTLLFESLAARVKEKNYTALALGENIASIDEIDYKYLENQIRDGLNEIEDMQSSMKQLVSGTNQVINGLIDSYGTLANQIGSMSGMEPVDFSPAKSVLNAYVTATGQQTITMLEQQYDAIEEQLNDIRSGRMKRTNDGVKHQLETAQNQLVMGAETLYITLLGLERSDAALTRSLEALERTIEEMELRHQMGQISELQLSQVTSGRTQLVSGQQTLQMNIELMRLQLNAMIGEELDADFKLEPLTAITQEQLEVMNPAADYAQAEEVSYETYAAQKALDDAEEDFKDAKKEYGSNSKKMEFTQAKHTWQAAQYTYDAAMQKFALKFRTLYAQVMDYAQILDAARAALALKQSEYEVAQLKYQQGAISHNALLDAENELLSAQETVLSAESDLFGAYNNYQWALRYGILN